MYNPLIMTCHESLKPQPYSASDIDSLYQLEQEAFPIDGWSLETIQAEASLTPPRLNVIRQADEVIAYVHTQLGPDHPGQGDPLDGILGSLAVRKQHQGKGYGQTLLDFAINYLKDQGARRILAHTRPNNAAMIKLFLKSGFCNTAIAPIYYEDKTDALIWELPITT